MKTIAVIPVHGRLPLVKKTIERLLKKNGCSQVICVGGTEQEKQVCTAAGAVFVPHVNQPLARKWNAGFLKAREYKPDACLFVGSSDWVSDNWLPSVAKHIDKFEMIGKLDFYLLDINLQEGKPNTYRSCWWPGYKGEREGECIGIGRVISSRILEKLAWRPFDDNLNNGLDFSMHHRVLRNKGRILAMREEDMRSLSISTNAWPNKHQFEQHWGNGPLASMKIMDTEAFLKKDFPEYDQVFA